MPRATDYARVAIFTLVPWYSFILLVETLTRESSNLQPCQNDNPCVFLRYFSSPSLPSSKVQHLSAVSQDGHLHFVNREMQAFNSSGHWDLLARFMYIRNGQEVESTSLYYTFQFIYDSPFVISGFPALSFVSLSGAFFDYFAGERDYASPICGEMSAASMGFYCDTNMRDHIENHLAHSESSSSIMYMVFITGWAGLTIAHDWMLLMGFTEVVTLWVSFCSLACNMAACVSGVVWCLGAMEVFVAKDPGNDCACYFQLPELSVLLALVQPVVLLFRVYSGLFMLFLSVQHGDFLLTTTYVVPYRFSAAAMPANPMKPSLHVESLQGGQWSSPVDTGMEAESSAVKAIPKFGRSKTGMSKTEPLPKHQLSFANLRRFIFALKYIVIFWHNFCATAIGALVIGPLFVRVYLYVAIHRNMVRYMLVMFSCGVSAGVVFLNFKFRIPRLTHSIKALEGFSGNVWRTKVGLAGLDVLKRVGDVITFFTPILLYSHLFNGERSEFNVDAEEFDSSQIGDSIEKLLPDIWTINCAGVYLFFAMIAIFKETILNEVQLAAQMRVLGVGHGVQPRDWIKLSELIPEWGLDVQADLADRFLDMLTQEEAEESAQVKRRFLAFLWPLHDRLKDAPDDESHYESVARVVEEVKRAESDEEVRQQRAASLALMAEGSDDEEKSFEHAENSTQPESYLAARLRAIPVGERLMDSFMV